jgi:hypothetical protein
MSSLQNRAQLRRNSVAPAQGEMRRADGVTYQEVPGLPDGVLMFRCERYKAALLTTACAKRHASSYGPAGAVGESLEKCRGCPIGLAHLGGESVSRPSILTGQLALMCLRCGRGNVKLVRKTLCPSCANRTYEAERGKNAKGTAPVKLKLSERMVLFRVGDHGDVQELTAMTGDIAEAILMAIKQNPGCQVLDTVTNGNLIEPEAFEPASFQRGPHHHLRRRTASDGVEVIVEVEESKQPTASAEGDRRLAEAAAAARVEVMAAPYDAEIATKGKWRRFTDAQLVEIDNVLRTTIAAGRTSVADCAHACNAAGLGIEDGQAGNTFLRRRLERLGLRESAEAAAEKLRPIVEALLAEGVAGPYALANRLNDAGCRTRKGRPFYGEAVEGLMATLGLRLPEVEREPVDVAHVPAWHVEVGLAAAA